MVSSGDHFSPTRSVALSGGSVAGGASPARAYGMVAVLTLAYVVSFADRMLLAMLIDPVRESLGLTDTQISLMLGLAFVLFYTSLSLPLGKIADRHDRSLLLTLGILAWSAATAACGLATNIWQLFLARMGVGAGEASLAPASYSLISDYFPPERVGSAMAIYASGITLGSGTAFALGGALVQSLGPRAPVSIPLLGEIEGWRAAFIVLGLVGIPMALLVNWVIREPRRKLIARIAPNAPLASMRRFIWRRRAGFVPILIGYAALSIVTYGISTWAVAFFQRVHFWSPAPLGAIYGALLGIGGTAGVLAGGFLTDWLSRRGTIDGSARVVLASVVLQCPLYVTAFLVSDWKLAIILFGAAVMVSAVAIGLQNVTIQAMTPAQLRGRMSAVFLLLANLLGLGVGPTIIGAMTDYVYTGPTAIGASLATTVAMCLPLSALLIVIGLAPSRRLIALEHRRAQQLVLKE